MPPSLRNPELELLRLTAREVLENALRAVNPREAVKRIVSLSGTTLIIGDDAFDISSREVYAIAIGKAASAMATGFSEILGRCLNGGVLTGPSEKETEQLDLAVWSVFPGGHPLPNEDSLAAADAALTLMERAQKTAALVVFLISGGGSAMMEKAVDAKISLEDLRTANQLLVNTGATISEVNAVRRAFSAVKGGGLANAAPATDQVTLILSDTNPGDFTSVASGPSLVSAIPAPSPQDVVKRYGLAPKLPHSIAETIGRNEPTSHSGTGKIRAAHVLADNKSALEAAANAARTMGFVVEIAEDIVEQPIERGCHELLDRLRELTSATKQSVCLLSGGEFACPVRGNGIGGRNLETALRCAFEIPSRHTWKHVLVLSAGTDGIDGNSPAAGAFADETTMTRAESLGLDPQEFLETSNSYEFFKRLDDLILTGATGTNVRDIRIVLALR